VTEANGNVTGYVVDDFGQTVVVDSPVTGVTEMTYDEAGSSLPAPTRGVSPPRAPTRRRAAWSRPCTMTGSTPRR